VPSVQAAGLGGGKWRRAADDWRADSVTRRARLMSGRRAGPTAGRPDRPAWSACPSCNLDGQRGTAHVGGAERRIETGRIVKAFGFDLSLLMERHEEFKKIAAEAQIERNRMKKLRQQKTLARKAIDQAAEELSVQGYDSEALQCLLQEKAELVKAGSRCHQSSDLAMVVQFLERRRDEIQRMLSDLVKPVETAPTVQLQP
jgi:Replication protein C N-terminal domain